MRLMQSWAPAPFGFQTEDDCLGRSGKKGGNMKYNIWTPERDAHLKKFYTPTCRVDPAILAYKLGTKETYVINRLSQLGLRSKRSERNVQRRYIA